MPEDQAVRFIESAYVPLPAMLQFHASAREADRIDGPDIIGLAGTRGPGKSHAALAQAGLDDCQRVEGLKYLFLRKVQKSAKESFEDLIRKVFVGISYEYKTSSGVVEFPNGSRIFLGGYYSERDIDKYLGIEYDGAVIEEATQLPEEKINKVYGSVRTSKPGWKPRKYLTTNADGIGLAWFKQQLVIPWRNKKQQWTRYFEASYHDNPFLDAGYIRYLEGLKGALGKAWRECDWDAFGGMAFPQWREDEHVINPFDIPDHWLKWRAVDDGWSAPWCTLWFAKNPENGRIYVYREAYQTHLTAWQQAERIVDMTPDNEAVSFTFADPAMWAPKNVQGIVSSPADDYRDKGVPLTKANNARIHGKRSVDNVLAHGPDGDPMLQIFENCVNLIRTMPLLPRDESNPEDVDTKAEDHAYDTLKYGLTNVRLPDAQKPPRHRKKSNNVPAMAQIGVL